MSSVRNLYSGIATAIQKKLVKPAVFIQADFPSGTRRIWSGLGPKTFAGATWDGVGEIKGLDSFIENMDSAANGIMCGFDALDDDGILDTLLTDDYQGATARVYLSFFDTSTGYLIGGSGATDPLPDEAETTTWKAAVASAGGTVLAEEAEICNQFISQASSLGILSKIKYFIPFLGSDLDSAIVPLIDTISEGAPTNNGFVEDDYDRAVGITSDVSSGKNLITGFNASTQSDIKGMGCLIRDKISIGGYFMGYINNANNRSWMIDVSTVAPRVRFTWASSGGDGASLATSPNDDFYYAQKTDSPDKQQMYKGGTLIAEESPSSSASGINDQFHRICGAVLNSNEASMGATMLCAFFTDGELSPTEVASLNTLLNEQFDTARAALAGAFVPDYTPMILWEGYLDREEIISGVENSKAKVYAEHKLVDQLRKRISRWTYADQARLYPGETDTGLNWIEKIQDKASPWGRSE